MGVFRTKSTFKCHYNAKTELLGCFCVPIVITEKCTPTSAFYTSKMGILPNVTRETFYRKRDHSPLILAHHLTPFDQKSTACFWLRFDCSLVFAYNYSRALFIKYRRVCLLVQKKQRAVCIYRIGMQDKHSNLSFYILFSAPCGVCRSDDDNISL